MINKFEYYLKMGRAKRKTPDTEEAKMLLEKAKKRIAYLKEKTINKETASFVLEDAYEAIREATQALMSTRGFKPYSHEATISFIKEFYNENFTDSEIAEFDRYRILRNDSVYKALFILPEDAKKSLDFAMKFTKKINEIMRIN